MDGGTKFRDGARAHRAVTTPPAPSAGITRQLLERARCPVGAGHARGRLPLLEVPPCAVWPCVFGSVVPLDLVDLPVAASGPRQDHLGAVTVGVLEDEHVDELIEGAELDGLLLREQTRVGVSVALEQVL